MSSADEDGGFLHAIGAPTNPVGGTPKEALQDSIRYLAAMLQQDVDHVLAGLTSIILRVVESRLLSDPVLLGIGRYADAYLGREEQLIKDRIQELWGFSPPPRTVQFVREAVRNAFRSRGVDEGAFEAVADAQIASTSDRQLRCAICGYHFRETDVGDRRRLILENVEAVLAESLHPGRQEDPFKPTKLATGRSLTTLTLDHTLPDSGFGLGDAANLAIVCAFCNHGKGFYFRGLEPLSSMVAGSLLCHDDSSRHVVTKQQVVVSSLMHAGRACSTCGAPTRMHELTVVPNLPADPLWLVPWALSVRCYKCAAASTTTVDGSAA